ncbi:MULTISPECIES: TPM domain-containing protein [unclassified Moraxella]|uniref:TPM domain-containing protein n=1 Tax=unclassified Moraxella TaxID=2685852 RepID=UPI003AF9EBF7
MRLLATQFLTTKLMTDGRIKFGLLDMTTLPLLLLILALLLPITSHAIPIEQVPRPDHKPVIDEANLLNDSEEAKLIQQITDLHNQTGDYIVVVTLPSISDTDLTPKQYATKLFEAWQIGNKDKDNGLLILDVADVRRLEMETGYGLEGALPDVTLKRIQTDVIVPAFKQGDFATGFEQGVTAIGEKLIEEQQANVNSNPQNGNAQNYNTQSHSLLTTSIGKPFGILANYFVISLLFFGIFSAGFFYRRAELRYQFDQPFEEQDIDLAEFQELSKQLSFRNVVSESSLGIETAFFFLFPCIFGLGFLFYWFFSDLGFMTGLTYLLVVVACFTIFASLLTLRRPTSHLSYFNEQITDLAYFYELTNPKYSTAGMIVRAILSPLFGLAILPYWFKQKNLHTEPRPCPQCDHTMHLLPKDKSFAMLSKFHQHEVSQGFAEFEIWLCDKCHYQHTLRYASDNKKPYYFVCPSCQQKAYCLVDKKTLQPATYESEGLRVDNYECLACGLQNNVEYVVPMLVRESSSDSSSSSSGSSWSSSNSDSGYSSSDGGSSGGGGSGSDY